MSVAGQQQNIFKKVALSQKKALLREICTEQLQVMVKGSQQETIFHLIAMEVDEKDELLLCYPTTDTQVIEEPQKVVVNFQYKDERYFFSTDLIILASRMLLLVNVDLFQLQRRANVRINIPDNYEAVFQLTEHQGKIYFLECRIKDVSAGGFKMRLPGDNPELKLGVRLKGSFRLGNRRPMEVEVEVRFSNQITENGRLFQVAGVQFWNRDTAKENRLLILMMDLQRELYLKYSN